MQEARHSTVNTKFPSSPDVCPLICIEFIINSHNMKLFAENGFSSRTNKWKDIVTNAHLGQSAIIKSDILPLFSPNGPPVMLYITRLRGDDCRKIAKIVKEANSRNNPPLLPPVPLRLPLSSLLASPPSPHQSRKVQSVPCERAQRSECCCFIS